MSEARLQLAIRANEPGACTAALCREAGISRQTGELWKKRYREGGAKDVIEKRSRRPHVIPSATGAEVVEVIKALRQEKPDWGARKLLRFLLTKHPKWEELKISPTTVHRILDREGLIAPEDRRRPAVQRFERKEPNELWQMDFKGPQGFNQGVGPLSVLDDYSRYLLVLKQLRSTRLKGVQAALQSTFQENGLPEFFLIDHGTPWYNGWSGWGWTELTVWIMRQGVRIILSGVRHPQTQGKVERMHGALQRAVGKRKPRTGQAWLDEFRYEYNHLRPHEGIGMIVPAERWSPSVRPFQPQPKEWEYPAEWEVCRLAGEGQLGWNGRRWEVSAALRHQVVALQQCGDRVLVHFCNMPLRELNLRTGKSVLLPANPFRDLHC